MSTTPHLTEIRWRERQLPGAGGRAPVSVAPADELRRLPLETLGQWRKDLPGTRSQPVWVFSETEQRLVLAQSLVEADWVLRLDLDPAVESLATEPCMLRWSDRRSHVPDAAVLLADGRRCIVDVRPAELLADVAELFDRTAAACAAAGLRYVVLTDHDPVLRSNVKAIASARRRRDGLGGHAERILALVGPAGVTVAELSDRLDAEAGVRSPLREVMHLLWDGRLEAALDAEHLQHTTLVRRPVTGDGAWRRVILDDANLWHRERMRGAGSDALPITEAEEACPGRVPHRDWAALRDAGEWAPPPWAAHPEAVPEEHRADWRLAVARHTILLEFQRGSTPGAEGVRPGLDAAHVPSRVARRAELARLLSLLQLSAVGPDEAARADGEGRDRAQRGVSKATTHNYERLADRFGAAGLLDGRSSKRVRHPRERHPEVYEAAEEIVAGTKGAADVTVEVLMQDLHRLLDERGFPGRRPAETELRAQLGRAQAEQDLCGDAKDRATQPPAGYGRFTETAPGAVVAVDSTPCDLLVWDPVLRVSYPVAVTAWVDVATSMPLHVAIHGKGTDADAIAFGTASLLRRAGAEELPWIGEMDEIRELGFGEELASRLWGLETDPAHVLHLDAEGRESYWRALPACAPERLLMDRGAAERSMQVLEALGDVLQSSVVFCAPRSGWMKGTVESFLGTLSDACLAQVPGYRGHHPRMHGTKEPARLLTVEELHCRIIDYLVKVHVRRERVVEGLLGVPRATASPLERWIAALSAHGTRELAYDPRLALELYRSEWRPVSRRGVVIDGHAYAGRVLGDLVGRPTAHPRDYHLFKTGGDMRSVLVQHPERGWVEVDWVLAGLVDGPMSRQRMRALVETQGGRTRTGRADFTRQVASLLTGARELAGEGLPEAARRREASLVLCDRISGARPWLPHTEQRVRPVLEAAPAGGARSAREAPLFDVSRARKARSWGDVA